MRDDLQDRLKQYRLRGLPQYQAYQQAAAETDDDDEKPSLLDRARAGIRGLPGYDRARDLAYGISDVVQDIPEMYGQFSRGVGSTLMRVPEGVARLAGMEEGAEEIRAAREAAEAEYGAPETTGQTIAGMVGTMAPYVGVGAAVGGAGTPSLLRGIAADVALDAPVAASGEDASTAGMIAEYADPEGLIGRAAQGLSESPLGRAASEAVVSGGAGLALAEGLPRAYRGLRGMGQAGAAVNPAAAPTGRVPGQVDSGLQGRWYSRLRRAVEQAPQETATAEQWQGMIRKAREGVSESEREWTGLDEFLQGRAGQKVTRDELLEQVGPGIGLTESVLDSQPSSVPMNWRQTEDGLFSEEGYRISHRTAPNQFDRLGEHPTQYEVEYPGGRTEMFNDRTAARHAAEQDWNARFTNRRGRAKFESYTQPGGENYREVLVQLDRGSDVPEGITVRNDPEYGWMAETRGGNVIQGESREGVIANARRNFGNDRSDFRSSHFDEPNVLAHLRMTDRTVDGEKTLFIEEIQSDWHQKGRELGYKGDPLDPERYEIVTERNLSGTGEPSLFVVRDKREGRSVSSFTNRDEAEAFMRSGGDQGVPDAPLKNTDEWVGLAFRRALQEAVDGGYDRVAWSSADQQLGLYGTQRVTWEKVDDGFRVKVEPQVEGNVAGVDLANEAAARGLIEDFDGVVKSQEELAEVLRSRGRGADFPADFDEKLWSRMQSEGRGVSMPRYEGMKYFYDDTIVPKVVQKEAKRLGVEIEPVVVRETLPATDADVMSGVRAPSARAVQMDDGSWQVQGGGRVIDEGLTREDARRVVREFMDSGKPEPTNLSIRITPQARERIKNEGLRLGQAVPEIPGSIAGAGVGAATGAAVDEEDPLRGAAIGGLTGAAAGAMAPRAIRGLQEMGEAGAAVNPLARPEPRLRATHNTTVPGIEFAEEMGGIPNPSLAVHRADQAFDSMGEVSLVGNRNLVDPASPGVEVYDADIYSARTPRRMFRTTKESDALIEELVAENRRMEGSSGWAPGMDELSKGEDAGDVADRLSRNTAGQSAYLRAQGVELEPEMGAPRFQSPAFDTPEVQAWARSAENVDIEFGSDAHREWSEAVKAGLRRQFAEFDPELAEDLIKRYTNDDGLVHYNQSTWLRNDLKKLEAGQEIDTSATRKAVQAALEEHGGEQAAKQWWEGRIRSAYGDPYFETSSGRKRPFTLEGLSDEMSRLSNPRARERRMVYGPGEARAASARRLSSAQEFDDYRGALVSSEQIDEVKKAQEAVRGEVAERLVRYQPDESMWDTLDDMHRAAGRYGKGARTEAAARRALEATGFRGADDEAVAAFKEYAESIVDAPTQYLEVKMRRPVQLDEFSGAVVPDDTPPNVIDGLKARGLEVETYPRHDAQARMEAFERMKGGREGLEEAGMLFVRGTGPLAGAAIGATQGDTAEERARNAMIGGLVGLGVEAAAPRAIRGLREMGDEGHLIIPSGQVDPLEAKIRQIEAGGVDAMEQQARRIEARRLAQQVQDQRQQGILRGRRPEERPFGELSDDDLIAKWAQYQRGGGRAALDAEVATINNTQRTVYDDGTVTAGLSSRGQSGKWARGRKTQADQRISQVEDELRARGIQVDSIDPYLNVTQADVLPQNKDLVGRGGENLRNMSDDDLAKELEAAQDEWLRNREDPAINERMAILNGESSRPGRNVDARMGAVVLEVPGSVAGGTLGAVMGAQSAEEGESRVQRALVGGALGAGAGAVAGHLTQRGLKGLPDAPPTSGLRAAGQAPTVTPSQAALAAADEVNLRSFNLPKSEEVRLRNQVARIIQGSRDSDIGRRMVKWGEVRRFANDLGVDVSDLNRTAASRMNAAEMLATRDIIAQNIDDLTRIERRLHTGLSETGLPLTRGELDDARRLVNSLEAQNNQMMRRFMIAKSEAGRDLNSLKIMANRSLDPVAWFSKAGKVKGSPLSEFEERTLRRLLARGDRAELVRYVGSLYDAPMSEKLVTLWKAGLLSNPTTHMANMVGNFSMATMETLKDAPAALFDRIAASISDVRAKDGISLDAVKAGWEAADFRGAIRQAVTGNMDDAALLAKYDIQRQVDFDNWGKLSPFLNAYAGPNSRIFASLQAGDKVFKSYSLARSLQEQARVMAMNEGLKKGTQEFVQRVAELVENDAALHARAIADAEIATFLNKGGHTTFKGIDLAEAGEGFRRNLGVAGHVAMPFTRTPANIMDRVLEYSPIGYLADLPKAADWIQKIRQGQKAGGLSTQDLAELMELQKVMVEQAGRATVGTVAMAAGYAMAQKGLLTGNYPSDSTDRNIQDLVREQPHSIKVGDHWLSLDRLSPLGNLLTIGAEIHRMAEDSETGLDAAVTAMPGIMGKTVIDQSFLRGLQGSLDALTAPERSFGRWVRQTAASVVPSGVYAVTRAIDPTLRDAQTVPDAIKSRLPGLSKSVTPTLDAFGEERQRAPSLVGRASQLISPMTMQQAREEPIRQEVADVGASISRYAPRGVERGTPEYADLQRQYGQATQEAVERAMRLPAYQNPQSEIMRMRRLPENQGRSDDELAKQVREELIEREVRNARARLTRSRSGGS